MSGGEARDLVRLIEAATAIPLCMQRHWNEPLWRLLMQRLMRLR
jgi:hypothetical protein